MHQLWIAVLCIEYHNTPAFIPYDYGKAEPAPGYHIYLSPVEPFVQMNSNLQVVLFVVAEFIELQYKAPLIFKSVTYVVCS